MSDMGRGGLVVATQGDAESVQIGGLEEDERDVGMLLCKGIGGRLTVATTAGVEVAFDRRRGRRRRAALLWMEDKIG